MSRPRVDDIVIAASGRQERVVRVGPAEVTTIYPPMGRRGRRRHVPLRNLECIDHDEGLWAEIAGGGNAQE